jgi:hypothetical protein
MESVRINTRFKHGSYGQGIESPLGHDHFPTWVRRRVRCRSGGARCSAG